MRRSYRRVRAIGFAVVGITFLASAVGGLYVALSGDILIARSGGVAGSFVTTTSFLGFISVFVLVIGAMYLLQQRRRK